MRVRSCFVADLPLFLFAGARVGVAAPIATATDVSAALAAPDGAAVSLQTVLVDKAARGYIVVRAPWSADERVVVVAAVNVKRWQPVAVKGTLTTLVNGSRAIRADEVLVYTDAEGAPVICPIPPPMTKGAIAASFSTAAAAIKLDELAMLAEDETPPVPDPTPPAVEPQYVVGTISEALALDEGSTVRINGKPIASTGDDPTYGAYFVAGEDGSSETLKTFSSATASTEMRAAGLTGTIAIQAGVGKVLSTDTGPGNPPEGFHGLAQLAVAVDVFGAKTKPDDMEVQLVGKVVSRAFPSEDVFYIQEPDRACGIKVVDAINAASVAPGDLVSVTGFISTNASGERYIEASTTEITGSIEPPVPAAMINRTLGGGDFHYNATTGAGQKGVSGVAYGLNNVGLLVRTTGKVTAIGSDYFYVDDGSNLSDGSGHTGVRVANVPAATVSVGNHVGIVGISGLEGSDPSFRRVLRPADTADVETLDPLAPANLTASAGNTSASLVWDAAPVSSYAVFRGASQSGSFTRIATATTTAYVDSGLTNGTTYWYKVASISLGEGTPTAAVSATPTGAAPMVTMSNLAVNDGTLSVDYTATAGSSGDEPSMVAFGLDGALIWADTPGLHSHFVLDTTQFANGPHRLSITAISASAAGVLTSTTAVQDVAFDNFASSFTIPEVAYETAAISTVFAAPTSWTLRFLSGSQELASTSGTGTVVCYTWDSSQAYGNVTVELSYDEPGPLAAQKVRNGRTYVTHGVYPPTPLAWAAYYPADAVSGQELWYRQDYNAAASSLLDHFGVPPGNEWRGRIAGCGGWDTVIDPVLVEPDFWPGILFFSGHGEYVDRDKSMLYQGAVAGSFTGGRTCGLTALTPFGTPSGPIYMQAAGPALGNGGIFDPLTGRVAMTMVHKRLDFVFFNTCFSGGRSSSSRLPLLPLAFGLPRQRVSGLGAAYLGIVDTAENDDATLFNQTFWNYLEQGYTIARAAFHASLATGKRVKYRIGGDPGLRLW